MIQLNLIDKTKRGNKKQVSVIERKQKHKLFNVITKSGKRDREKERSKLFVN